MDFIDVARAKGASRGSVIFKHATRNAAIPVLTVIALNLPALFTGSIITETIFAWPGMGRLYYSAATSRDFPVLLGILIIGAGIIIISNLLADIGYAFLDPRVRYD